jgi:hypothetical protein
MVVKRNRRVKYPAWTRKRRHNFLARTGPDRDAPRADETIVVPRKKTQPELAWSVDGPDYTQQWLPGGLPPMESSGKTPVGGLHRHSSRSCRTREFTTANGEAFADSNRTTGSCSFANTDGGTYLHAQSRWLTRFSQVIALLLL